MKIKRTLAAKLEAMADPRRNDNAHERAVAVKKLAELNAKKKFSVTVWCKAHGVDPRRMRKALRASGKRAPYKAEDMLWYRYSVAGEKMNAR